MGVATGGVAVRRRQWTRRSVADIFWSHTTTGPGCREGGPVPLPRHPTSHLTVTDVPNPTPDLELKRWLATTQPITASVTQQIWE